MTTPVASRLDVDRISATPIDRAGGPRTAFELLRRGAAAWPNRIALRYLPSAARFEDHHDYTYATLHERVCATASLFADYGAARDDVVAVALPNLPETHFAIWGAQAVATVMPLNRSLPPADLARLLALARASMLVTDAALWAQHGDLLASGCPALEHVFLVGNGDTLGRPELAVHDFAVALNRYGGTKADIALPPPEHAGIITSTAGTTGLPRLVRRTLASDLRSAKALRPMLGDLLSEQTVVAGGLPLFHSAVITAAGPVPWSEGATVITAGPQGYLDPDYLRNFWRIVDRYRVCIALMVPAVVSQLIRTPIGDADIGSLSLAISGTARLPRALHRRFERATGVRLLSSYGLVEAGCIATMTPPAGERRAGSAGIALPWHRTRVAHVDEAGRFAGDCDIDETGRLLVSSPSMCQSYVDDGRGDVPWIECGDGLLWIDTGDLARIDADGFHWIAGPRSEVIRCNGRYIDPAAIEEPLLSHPMVAMAAAIARPDPRKGEVPVVFAVLRDGGQSDSAALMDFLEQALDDPGALPAEVLIVEALPLTRLGKIDRVTLRRGEAETAVGTVTDAADAASRDDDTTD